MLDHKGTITLETERLILRQFKIEDADAMFQNWASDPEVTRFLTWPTHTSVDVSKAVIYDWKKLYENPNHYSWAIVLKELGEPIGSIAAVKQDSETDMVHIGYCIGKAWWRKGYTSEALCRLVRFFFEDVGVNRIESRHDPRNTNSGKVMLKAGMKFEGITRQSDLNNQGICDAAWFAILADDYFKRTEESGESTNVITLKTGVEAMFRNMKTAMDTVDWNTDICGTPAWRYIYHTLHSADKWFINPSKRNEEPEPPFHTPLLDWPDTPSELVLSHETLYGYYEQVRSKILDYCDSLNDSQLNEPPQGCTGTRLGLLLSQFRHMYAHIGILNGVTIANTGNYPLIINESTWRSGIIPEGLFDVEERI
jgi:ribosomal-protein-alanine N-acetyltransferase